MGVEEAMNYQQHEHLSVPIRQPIGMLREAVRTFKPDILWTHMWMWAPSGSPCREDLLDLSEEAARAGTKIVIHDGDFKSATRYPHDISSWCSVALLNHEHDRSAWNVPTLYWPYFAQIQQEIEAPAKAWECELFFAGNMGTNTVYSERTQLLRDVEAAGVDLMIPTGVQTRQYTGIIAASANAIIGFGRPDVPGWLDTRIWQYISAGGILLHDDVGGYFEPWEHYIPYESKSVESVVSRLKQLASMSTEEKWALRERAFTFGQTHHSSVVRVQQVLDLLFPDVVF